MRDAGPVDEQGRSSPAVVIRYLSVAGARAVVAGADGRIGDRHRQGLGGGAEPGVAVRGGRPGGVAGVAVLGLFGEDVDGGAGARGVALVFHAIHDDGARRLTTPDTCGLVVPGHVTGDEIGRGGGVAIGRHLDQPVGVL